MTMTVASAIIAGLQARLRHTLSISHPSSRRLSPVRLSIDRARHSFSSAEPFCRKIEMFSPPAKPTGNGASRRQPSAKRATSVTADKDTSHTMAGASDYVVPAPTRHFGKMATIRDLTELSPSEIALLRKTWAFVSDSKMDISRNIFCMIFEQSPEAKDMFGFGNATSAEMWTNSEFQFHSLRFVQVIESAIGCLDTPSTLQPLLLNLGRRHAKLAESRGFNTHYWAVFIECTLFHLRRCLREVADALEQLDVAIILWRVLLRAVVHGMKLGFKSGLEKRTQNRSDAAAARNTVTRVADAPKKKAVNNSIVDSPTTAAAARRSPKAEK